MQRGFDPTQYGKHIKIRRKYLGLSIKQLAERSGEPASEISDYEKGQDIPNAIALQKIADGLDIASIDLMFGDNLEQ